MLLSLGREFSLGLVTVSLALAVLLVRVLDCDLLAQQVLPVHSIPRHIRSLEPIERDKSIALGHVVLVANDSRRRNKCAELRERVVKDLLIHLLVQVIDEQLGANVGGLLLVGAGLVDADGLLVQSDAVEYLGCVVGALGGVELDEPVALVCA